MNVEIQNSQFKINMVGVVQLVRAPDCGSGGRGFEPHLPPKEQVKWPAFLFAIERDTHKKNGVSSDSVSVFGVGGGVRTHDLQIHNLAL